VKDRGWETTHEENGMSGETIKLALAGATAYLTANPAEARYRDGAARAVLRDGLVVDTAGPDGEAVTTDMSRSVGGSGSAPSPGWLFRAAAASCAATLIAMRAAMLDVRIGSLEVTVDSESDDRGILGIDPSTPAGPLSVRVAVSVRASGTDADEVRAIIEWGVEHCPVVDAVRRSVPTEITIEA
jgi:uncharacterized OsmC-like protein